MPEQRPLRIGFTDPTHLCDLRAALEEKYGTTKVKNKTDWKLMSSWMKKCAIWLFLQAFYMSSFVCGGGDEKGNSKPCFR